MVDLEEAQGALVRMCKSNPLKWLGSLFDSSLLMLQYQDPNGRYCEAWAACSACLPCIQLPPGSVQPVNVVACFRIRFWESAERTTRSGECDAVAIIPIVSAQHA